MKSQNSNIKNKKTAKKRNVYLRLFFFFISFLLLARTYLYFSAFLFLAFCVLLFIRYDAWFGNLPEEPYTLPSHIDRITLTPGKDFMRERTISWRYDTIKHNAKVEYFRLDSLITDTSVIDIPATGRQIKSRAGKAYYYHAKLPELERGNTYSYRVISKDTSEWKSFTMPKTKDTLNFIYIGDVQDPKGTQSDSLFNILKNRNLDYDFIAFGGDQIERPMDKYWKIWYKTISKWAGTIPLVMVAGNHEYIKGLNKSLDARWTAQHNYPENGPDGFKGKSYYIDFPLMRMIVLDSNIIQWPYAVFQHLIWLKKTLEETTQPWTVVMFHHGVNPVREGRSHPLMKYLFKPILEKHGVDLVLQGHDHAYSRITTNEKGNMTSPVFIISSASPKNYRNGFDPIHDRLGSNLALYQSIQITKKSLAYQASFFDGTLYDDLRIERSSNGDKKVIDNAKHWEELFLFDHFDKNEKGRNKRNKYLQKINERKSRLRIKQLN